MQINLNHHVVVRLTDYGLKVLLEYNEQEYDKLADLMIKDMVSGTHSHADIPKSIFGQYHVEADKFRFQFTDLMRIFGAHMRMGAREVFASMEVDYDNGEKGIEVDAERDYVPRRDYQHYDPMGGQTVVYTAEDVHPAQGAYNATFEIRIRPTTLVDKGDILIFKGPPKDPTTTFAPRTKYGIVIGVRRVTPMITSSVGVLMVKFLDEDMTTDYMPVGEAIVVLKAVQANIETP